MKLLIDIYFSFKMSLTFLIDKGIFQVSAEERQNLNKEKKSNVNSLEEKKNSEPEKPKPVAARYSRKGL